MDADTDSVVTLKKRKKTPTSQWCSAISCKNSRYKNPGLAFFRFFRFFSLKLNALQCAQHLKSNDCKCNTPVYVASLFLKVRINHELILKNDALTLKRKHSGEKVSKLAKLSRDRIIFKKNNSELQANMDNIAFSHWVFNQCLTLNIVFCDLYILHIIIFYACM